MRSRIGLQSRLGYRANVSRTAARGHSFRRTACTLTSINVSPLKTAAKGIPLAYGRETTEQQAKGRTDEGKTATRMSGTRPVHARATPLGGAPPTWTAQAAPGLLYSHMPVLFHPLPSCQAKPADLPPLACPGPLEDNGPARLVIMSEHTWIARRYHSTLKCTRRAGPAASWDPPGELRID